MTDNPQPQALTSEQERILTLLSQGLITVTVLRQRVFAEGAVLKQALDTLIKWDYVAEVMTPDGRRAFIITATGRGALEFGVVPQERA